MARSQYLFGRVQRTLDRLGLPRNDFRPQEIWDTIHQGQCEVFSRVKPDKEIDITTVVGTAEYSLLINAVESDENIFGKVLSCRVPSTWNYDLDFVSERDWKDVVRKISGTTQPLKATIFNNKLWLHPAPTVAGEIIKLWITKLSPGTRIASNVEPELSSNWDRAMEYFSIWSMTGDDKYLALFEKQVEVNKPTNRNKGLPRQRAADPVMNAS